MSLKAFHIFFIGVSALTAFGFAAWLMNGSTAGGGGDLFVGGILSIITGIGLILYGIRFLRKLKHVSYL